MSDLVILAALWVGAGPFLILVLHCWLQRQKKRVLLLHDPLMNWAGRLMIASLIGAAASSYLAEKMSAQSFFFTASSAVWLVAFGMLYFHFIDIHILWLEQRPAPPLPAPGLSKDGGGFMFELLI